jgi:hypothetical protein
MTDRTATPEPVAPVTEMVEALKPFAEIAEWYDDREDDSFEIWSDYPHGFINRDLAKLKHFRKARAAIAALSTRTPEALGPHDRIIYERGYGPGDGDSHVERVERVTRIPEAAQVEEMGRELAFVWKWVERGLFDPSIDRLDALKTLAHYPGAPWNQGRWDVDHKPYATKFYDMFPKAAALAQDRQPSEKEGL